MTALARNGGTFRSSPLPRARWADLNASQQGINGFNLATLQRARLLQLGAGGIGSHALSALIRKGLGHALICDDDAVSTRNCSRQLFDARHDTGQLKALALARRLTREAMFPATIVARPVRFQELVAGDNSVGRYDLIICGVDNNPTRRAVSTFGLRHKIPVIHAAVSHDGNSLYVMVQDSTRGVPCWGCVFPTYLNDSSYPCNLPGIIDVLQVAAGVIVFAVDTVLCGRPREWNVRHFYLDGAIPERVQTASPRPGCALCTGYNI